MVMDYNLQNKIQRSESILIQINNRINTSMRENVI